MLSSQLGFPSRSLLKPLHPQALLCFPLQRAAPAVGKNNGSSHPEKSRGILAILQDFGHSGGDFGHPGGDFGPPKRCSARGAGGWWEQASPS